MKNLVLVRHAEANPANGPHDDIARPLTEAGIAQAKAIVLPCTPTVVCCATSARARSTALIWAEANRRYRGSIHHVPFLSPHGFGDEDMDQEVFNHFLRACLLSDGTHSLEEVIAYFGENSEEVNALALASRMAWTQIARVCGPLHEGSVVAVFGHDVFLKAIAYYGPATLDNPAYPPPNGRPNDGDFARQRLSLGGVLKASIPLGFL